MTRRPVVLRCDPLEDRLTPAAGALDPTFGTGGIVRPNDGTVFGLAAAPDGRVLTLNATSVARFTAAGAADPSFGTGGRVALPTNSFPGYLVAAPDGGAYLVDQAGRTVTHFTTAGVIDPAFGTGGTLTIPYGTDPNQFGDERFTGLYVQPDGRLVAVGSVSP